MTWLPDKIVCYLGYDPGKILSQIQDPRPRTDCRTNLMLTVVYLPIETNIQFSGPFEPRAAGEQRSHSNFYKPSHLMCTL
jgi:hypothetical protein